MALTVNTNIINDTNGYLLDAKNVKGGYVVVANETERNGLPTATIVKGSLCYCVENSTTYRYNGSTWVEVSYNFLPLSGGTLTGNLTAPKFIGALQGNADTATKLKTARTISLTSDVTGSASFDGSGNVSITATVADDSHNHVISNVDNLQTTLDGKLNLSGGTMTGELTIAGNLKHATSTRTQNCIAFIASDKDGTGMVIGNGGLMVVGSGESAANLVTNLSLVGGSEQTYVTSDGDIYFYTNCQTIASKKLALTLDTSGNATATKFIGKLQGSVTSSDGDIFSQSSSKNITIGYAAMGTDGNYVVFHGTSLQPMTTNATLGTDSRKFNIVYGNSFTGNAATASVLKCSDAGGLTTDQYGNLVPNSTSAQYWNIYKNKDKSAVGFKVTWASGNVETAGTITASGAITSSSGVVAQSAVDQLMCINNNGTSAANAYLKVKVGGTDKAAVGYYKNMAFLSNEVNGSTAGYARIGVNDNKVPQYWPSSDPAQAQTLLHTGICNRIKTTSSSNITRVWSKGASAGEVTSTVTYTVTGMVCGFTPKVVDTWQCETTSARLEVNAIDLSFSANTTTITWRTRYSGNSYEKMAKSGVVKFENITYIDYSSFTAPTA